MPAKWNWDSERQAVELQTGLLLLNVGSNDGLLWLWNKQWSSLEAWEFHHQLKHISFARIACMMVTYHCISSAKRWQWCLTYVLICLAANFAYSESSHSLLASSYKKKYSESSCYVHCSCKTKIKHISQTQLYFKNNLYITWYSYMVLCTQNHHHRHQAFVRNLSSPLSSSPLHYTLVKSH